jgi:tetratricopeptide (TPR) repeat protein
MDGNLWLLRITLSRAYGTQGRYEEALAESDKALELSGSSTWVMANRVWILLQLDRRHEAEVLLSKLLERARDHYVPPFDLAVAYIALGDRNSALAMLQSAYEIHDPKMVFITWEMWSPIRAWPAYQELLQRMKLD